MEGVERGKEGLGESWRKGLGEKETGEGLGRYMKEGIVRELEGRITREGDV